jgi:hypothetical protein
MTIDRSRKINLVKYEKIENGEFIQICLRCRCLLVHLPNYTLKINRYKHYAGFHPLWLSEPNKEFFEWYKNVNQESIRFAELLATARNGIKR